MRLGAGGRHPTLNHAALFALAPAPRPRASGLRQGRRGASRKSVASFPLRERYGWRGLARAPDRRKLVEKLTPIIPLVSPIAAN
jgi:hypothetical protein